MHSSSQKKKSPFANYNFMAAQSSRKFDPSTPAPKDTSNIYQSAIKPPPSVSPTGTVSKNSNNKEPQISSPKPKTSSNLSSSQKAFEIPQQLPSLPLKNNFSYSALIQKNETETTSSTNELLKNDSLALNSKSTIFLGSLTKLPASSTKLSESTSNFNSPKSVPTPNPLENSKSNLAMPPPSSKMQFGHIDILSETESPISTDNQESLITGQIQLPNEYPPSSFSLASKNIANNEIDPNSSLPISHEFLHKEIGSSNSRDTFNSEEVEYESDGLFLNLSDSELNNILSLGHFSEFFAKKYFSHFTTIAEKIVVNISQLRLDFEPDLSTLIGFGVNEELDRVLDIIGLMSKYHTRLVVELFLVWRKSQVDKSIPHVNSSHERSVHIISERRSLATAFILCRALYKIVSNIDPRKLTEDFGHHIEKLVFDQILTVNPSILQSSKNRKLIHDFYAQIAGEISLFRFSSISDLFIAALEVPSNQSKLSIEKSVLIIRSMRYLKILLHPMDILEESCQFLLSCAKFFSRTSGSMRLKHAWAMTLIELLMPLINDIDAEVNLPVLSQAIELIHFKAVKMSTRARHIPIAFPLVSATLCLSKKEFFYSKWLSHIEACIQKFKDKSPAHRNVAIDSINRLVWVYLYRYPDTFLNVSSRLEPLIRSILPSNKWKNWNKYPCSGSISYFLIMVGCYNFQYFFESILRVMLPIKNQSSTSPQNVYSTLPAYSANDNILEDLNPERAFLAYQSLIEIAQIHTHSKSKKIPRFPSISNIDFYDGYFGNKCTDLNKNTLNVEALSSNLDPLDSSLVYSGNRNILLNTSSRNDLNSFNHKNGTEFTNSNLQTSELESNNNFGFNRIKNAGINLQKKYDFDYSSGLEASLWSFTNKESDSFSISSDYFYSVPNKSKYFNCKIEMDLLPENLRTTLCEAIQIVSRYFVKLQPLFGSYIIGDLDAWESFKNIPPYSPISINEVTTPSPPSSTRTYSFLNKGQSPIQDDSSVFGFNLGSGSGSGLNRSQSRSKSPPITCSQLASVSEVVDGTSSSSAQNLNPVLSRSHSFTSSPTGGISSQVSNSEKQEDKFPYSILNKDRQIYFDLMSCFLLSISNISVPELKLEPTRIAECFAMGVLHIDSTYSSISRLLISELINPDTSNDKLFLSTLGFMKSLKSNTENIPLLKINFMYKLLNSLAQLFRVFDLNANHFLTSGLYKLADKETDFSRTHYSSLLKTYSVSFTNPELSSLDALFTDLTASLKIELTKDHTTSSPNHNQNSQDSNKTSEEPKTLKRNISAKRDSAFSFKPSSKPPPNAYGLFDSDNEIESFSEIGVKINQIRPWNEKFRFCTQTRRNLNRGFLDFFLSILRILNLYMKSNVSKIDQNNLFASYSEKDWYFLLNSIDSICLSLLSETKPALRKYAILILKENDLLQCFLELVFKLRTPSAKITSKEQRPGVPEPKYNSFSFFGQFFDSIGFNPTSERFYLDNNIPIALNSYDSKDNFDQKNDTRMSNIFGFPAGSSLKSSTEPIKGSQANIISSPISFPVLVDLKDKTDSLKAKSKAKESIYQSSHVNKSDTTKMELNKPKDTKEFSGKLASRNSIFSIAASLFGLDSASFGEKPLYRVTQVNPSLMNLPLGQNFIFSLKASSILPAFTDSACNPNIIQNYLEKLDTDWQSFVQNIFKDHSQQEILVNKPNVTENSNINNRECDLELSKEDAIDFCDTLTGFVKLSCDDRSVLKYKFFFNKLLYKLMETAPMVVNTARSIIIQKINYLHPIIAQTAEKSYGVPLFSSESLQKTLPQLIAGYGAAPPLGYINNFIQSNGSFGNLYSDTFSFSGSRFNDRGFETNQHSKYDTFSSSFTTDMSYSQHQTPYKNANQSRTQRHLYSNSISSNNINDSFMFTSNPNYTISNDNESNFADFSGENTNNFMIWNQYARVPAINQYCSYLMFLMASLDESLHVLVGKKNCNSPKNINRNVPRELQRQSIIRNSNEKPSSLQQSFQYTSKPATTSKFQISWAKRLTGPLKLSSKGDRKEAVVEWEYLKNIISVLSPFLVSDHAILRYGVITAILATNFKFYPQLILELKPLSEEVANGLDINIPDFIQSNSTDPSSELMYKINLFNTSLVNHMSMSKTHKHHRSKSSGGYSTSQTSGFSSTVNYKASIPNISANLDNSIRAGPTSNSNNFPLGYSNPLENAAHTSTTGENSNIFNAYKKSNNNTINPKKNCTLRLSLSILYTFMIRNIITADSHIKSSFVISHEDLVEHIVSYLQELVVFLNSPENKYSWDENLLKLWFCNLTESLLLLQINHPKSEFSLNKRDLLKNPENSKQEYRNPDYFVKTNNKHIFFPARIPPHQIHKPLKTINKRYSKGNSESSIGLHVTKDEHNRSSSYDLAIKNKPHSFQLNVEMVRSIYKLLESWCNYERNPFLSSNAGNKAFQSAFNFYKLMNVDNALISSLIEDEIFNMFVLSVRLKSLLLKFNSEEVFSIGKADLNASLLESSSLHISLNNLLMWALQIYSYGNEELTSYASESVYYFIKSEFSLNIVSGIVELLFNPVPLISKIPSISNEISASTTVLNRSLVHADTQSVYLSNLLAELLLKVLHKLLVTKKDLILKDNELYYNIFCASIHCMRTNSNQCLQDSVGILKVLAKHKFVDFSETAFDVIKGRVAINGFDIFSKSIKSSSSDIVRFFCASSDNSSLGYMYVANSAANLVAKLCEISEKDTLLYSNKLLVLETLIHILTNCVVFYNEEMVQNIDNDFDLNEGFVYLLVYITQQLHSIFPKQIGIMWESLVCGDYGSEGLHVTEYVMEIVRILSEFLLQIQNSTLLEPIANIMSYIVSTTYLSDSTYKIIDFCLEKLSASDFVPKDITSSPLLFDFNHQLDISQECNTSFTESFRKQNVPFLRSSFLGFTATESWWNHFFKISTSITPSFIKNNFSYTQSGISMFILSILASDFPDVLVTHKSAYEFLFPICIANLTNFDPTLFLVRSASSTILLQSILFISDSLLKYSRTEVKNEECTLYLGNVLKSLAENLKRCHSTELFSENLELEFDDIAMELLQALNNTNNSCFWESIIVNNWLNQLDYSSNLATQTKIKHFVFTEVRDIGTCCSNGIKSPPKPTIDLASSDFITGIELIDELIRINILLFALQYVVEGRTGSMDIRDISRLKKDNSNKLDKLLKLIKIPGLYIKSTQFLVTLVNKLEKNATKSLLDSNNSFGKINDQESKIANTNSKESRDVGPWDPLMFKNARFDCHFDTSRSLLESVISTQLLLLAELNSNSIIQPDIKLGAGENVLKGGSETDLDNDLGLHDVNDDRNKDLSMFRISDRNVYNNDLNHNELYQAGKTQKIYDVHQGFRFKNNYIDSSSNFRDYDEFSVLPRENEQVSVTINNTESLELGPFIEAPKIHNFGEPAPNRNLSPNTVSPFRPITSGTTNNEIGETEEYGTTFPHIHDFSKLRDPQENSLKPPDISISKYPGELFNYRDDIPSSINNYNLADFQNKENKSENPNSKGSDGGSRKKMVMLLDEIDSLMSHLQ
ncbi:hypothetical protein BB560_004612 [Smittium megazygosporum]|uniref:Cell morphogenesis protein N-terminal domain-containing protein n=1 Tax=Smittium megazygosporum TaxID=133381 RepID=A0A2T9Z8Y4_9FUNG|nr:hypothetical protein BB560_004612 [Smittium megazygosporum]